MAYAVYVDGLLLPVAPSKLELKISGQNKTLTLINEGEINLLKQPKLSQFTFEMLLPQVAYPFAVYENGFVPATHFTDKLKALKTSAQPFLFQIRRSLPSGAPLFATQILVSLEDYSIKEEAGNGFDLVASVTLKEYRHHATKICNVTFTQTRPSLTIEPQRAALASPAPKTTAKTHRVVRGDCLYNIAKAYYGNGTKYPQIYKSNKEMMDKRNKNSTKYTIYPNQVLTIPI